MRAEAPLLRGGYLPMFNEEISSQAVFLRSAPLVSQRESQRDTKCIKV